MDSSELASLIQKGLFATQPSYGMINNRAADLAKIAFGILFFENRFDKTKMDLESFQDSLSLPFMQKAASNFSLPEKLRLIASNWLKCLPEYKEDVAAENQSSTTIDQHQLPARLVFETLELLSYGEQNILKQIKERNIDWNKLKEVQESNLTRKNL